MRVLIVTDAWHPQINGVVRTLTAVAEAAVPLGVSCRFLTPAQFRTVGLPSYPDVRLALATPARVARLIADADADSIHIATEGPLGIMARRHCLKRKLPFTTSFHTRFPDYISARWPIPESWAWNWLRRFHAPARAVMAATPGLMSELRSRGFGNVALWSRGVDTGLFRPRQVDPGLPRPIFLSVGRVAVEKNLDAFLSLDLPGTRVVVGDGPARAELEACYPQAVFMGVMGGERLAEVYAVADVFVFPSRTDTFGLVLLEALASGLPVAAFPAPGPRDVIGDAPVGILDHDLRVACLAALRISPKACRDFAAALTWANSAQAFVGNLVRLREEAGRELAGGPRSAVRPAA